MSFEGESDTIAPPGGHSSRAAKKARESGVVAAGTEKPDPPGKESNMKTKTGCFRKLAAVALAVLLCLGGAAAEESTPGTEDEEAFEAEEETFGTAEEEVFEMPETVSFGRLEVPTDTKVLEMGKVSVEKTDFDIFCDFLAALPELEHVEMFSSQVSGDQIAVLESRFPGVTFDWTIWIGNHLVRTDAVVFSTLHYDHDRRHTEADFALFRYCPNLLALDLGHNEIGDLSFLYHLPKLKVLILSDDRIACDITPIGSLTDLLFLEMYNNYVTDFTPLGKLTKLHHLNISFNTAAPETLSVLKDLTSLEHLWISCCHSRTPKEPLDNALVAELQKALPCTKINATARTRDGEGWLDFRDEKRVKRMFQLRKEYLPLYCENEDTGEK